MTTSNLLKRLIGYICLLTIATIVSNVRRSPLEYLSDAELFKKLYESNISANMCLPVNEQIPRIIHQIWIGPNSMPSSFKWMIQTWKDKHPNWHYKLWTNAEVAKLDLKNKAAFDSANNWGTKADILRYEILMKYGGVYVDTDFECLHSLEPLNKQYNFYCCIMTETVLANGVIACIPNHPIIAECIRQIGLVCNFDNDFEKIVFTTGPQFFTKIFAEYARKHPQHLITLSPEYFFPFPLIKRFDLWEGKISRSEVLSYIDKNTYAIHYWATSWWPKQGGPRLSETFPR